LLSAAENGHELVVKLLMAREDVDVNSKDIDGRTPFSIATKNGHEGVARLLLSQDDLEVNSKDNDSRTPLSYAAENGNEAVVRLLLEREDVDVSISDRDGQTPLSIATKMGQDTVVKLLLGRHEMEVKLKDRGDQTSLLNAPQNRRGEVNPLLAQGDVNGTSFSGPLQHGDAAVAECSCQMPSAPVVNGHPFFGNQLASRPCPEYDSRRGATSAECPIRPSSGKGLTTKTTDGKSYGAPASKTISGIRSRNRTRIILVPGDSTTPCCNCCCNIC